jgi:uncharacterized iron-regulated protein
MLVRCAAVVSLAALLAGLTSCSPAARIDLHRQTGGNAALFHQFQAYDGDTGRPLSFTQLADRCRDADVIFFGEQHSDAVCNQLEAQVLYALLADDRPPALAMEFFEADTQAALDAYLLGRLDEATFRDETRQNRAYVLAHRPLIELCRSGRVPVLAANAPRRLVRDYRRSDLPYEDFRAGLDADERRWLPPENAYLEGPYRDRFFDLMGGMSHGDNDASEAEDEAEPAPGGMPPATTQPTTMPADAMPASAMPADAMPDMSAMTEGFYRAQLLWDETMARSIADYRARYLRRRVMLIVGVFHVADTGGTVAKYRRLRPDDRVITVTYAGTSDGRLAFDPEDRGAGDVIVYGINPPPRPTPETPTEMPPTMPAEHPTTMPAEHPAMPTEHPTTMPAEHPAPPHPTPAHLAVPEVEEPPPDTPAEDAAVEPHVIEIPHLLVVPKAGRSGRVAIHTDAIEHMIVTGQWSPPLPQQSFQLPDGEVRTWTTIMPDEDGTYRHAALAGGYAFATVTLDAPAIMLLDAAGHRMVYVNGVPRGGDVYSHGYVKLPVQLRAGRNALLFRGGRGRLRARLVEPVAPVQVVLRDRTVPDLLADEPVDVWAGLIVQNATAAPLEDAVIEARAGDVAVITPLPRIPACSSTKVPVRLRAATPTAETEHVAFELVLRNDAANTQSPAAELTLEVVTPDQVVRRTFRSGIDGSVQYYAVRAAQPPEDAASPPALTLSLHGAGVEARGQARAYAAKDWTHVVAATNRRPYGFDWEDWGRMDALEVLADARVRYEVDPRRVYLTGHSMGGHGTWQVGVHYPDHFAAIAPSAGWISFASYTDGVAYDRSDPIQEILRRAARSSDTLALKDNYAQFGVYVLHGDRDDNVPVGEARAMRAQLGTFHPNFAYYEQPGAGHWWGNRCVDWPPLFDFLRQNTLPERESVDHVAFVTVDPAISATCHWVTIAQQVTCRAPSRVDVRIDREAARIEGTTENVRTLELHECAVEGTPVTIVLDETAPLELDWPAGGFVTLTRDAGAWTVAPPLAAQHDPPLKLQKTPAAAGPFKAAFDHDVLLVYGTQGDADENAWARNKACFDAESFWYRGNASLTVIPDVMYDAERDAERNVVLYGNAATNAAWDALFDYSPVQTTRGMVNVGERTIERDDLALLAVHAHPRTPGRLVAVVGGSGIAGMRLTERLPYFLAGVHYPDWIVLSPEMLIDGNAGVVAAGFYDHAWQLDAGQAGWRSE